MTTDIVYRCACSWVGGDPDTTRPTEKTCPKCLGRSHRCKTGDCRHCNRCDYSWVPQGRQTVYTCPACMHHDRKLVVVHPVNAAQAITASEIMPQAKRRKAPDLFRRDSKTSAVLRWMIEQGEVSAKDFKAAHVGLGGTTNSTHAFDRYFVGKSRRWSGDSYVPSEGSHNLLERIVEPGQRVNARNGKVRWVGSEGDTFEQRATAWFERLTPAEIDRALAFLEAEVFAVDQHTDTEEMRQRALAWFRIASGASGVRSTPAPASTVRDAAEVSALAS